MDAHHGARDLVSPSPLWRDPWSPGGLGRGYAALKREESDGMGSGPRASLLPVTTAPPTKPAETCRVCRPAAGGQPRWSGPDGDRWVSAPSLFPSPHPPALWTGCHPELCREMWLQRKPPQNPGRGQGGGAGPADGGHSPGAGSSGSSSSAAIAQRRSRLMARS